MANYPEPFVLQDINDPIEGPTIPGPNNTTNRQAVTATPPKPVFDPSAIQDTSIYNANKKSKVAILNIAGKEYLVKGKERAGNYTVKLIDKDKVIILFKEKKYTISKNNNL